MRITDKIFFQNLASFQLATSNKTSKFSLQLEACALYLQTTSMTTKWKHRDISHAIALFHETELVMADGNSDIIGTWYLFG